MNNYNEYLSKNANKAIQSAFAIAKRFNCSYVGSEHILYGLLAINEGIALSILKEAGVDKNEYEKRLKLKAEPNYKLNDFTPKAKHAIELAYECSISTKTGYIGTEHLLFALLSNKEHLGYAILFEMGIDVDYINNLLDEKMQSMAPVEEDFEEETVSTPLSKSTAKDLLSYGVDLTEKAKNGKLDPVVGRRNEIDRIIQILTRRTKNNPVLVGEPGVGKSAVIEGLAQAIVKGNVPDLLRNKIVFSLDLSSVVAGTKYRGEFEEKLKSIVDSVKKNGNILLFIDEIHNIVGAGSTSDGSMDAANILKPMLSRGELQTIGATTLDEYRKYIEKDPALERRFQPVTVNAPSVAETEEILKGLRDKYEAHHKVVITDEAIHAAATLSDRYITDRFLPDKAIDLIDEAASKVRLESYNLPEIAKEKERELNKLYLLKRESVALGDTDAVLKLNAKIEKVASELDEIHRKETENHAKTNLEIGYENIAEIISEMVGIPVKKLSATESDKLINLESELNARVIGQPLAVTAVSKAIRRARAGLKDENRPIGSFIFVGPTGVGKTELSKALAEVVFDDRDSLIRIDMSEYMEKHSVAKLIGAPPGYVGYDEAGQLTEKVRRKPYSVVLFDEVEKGHQDVFNLLLQILDDGRLSDSKGRLIDFKNCIIILTSNLGAGEVKRQPITLGFNATDSETEYERTTETYKTALKNHFRPEFLNRLDEIVVFNSLTTENATEILDILLNKLSKRLEQMRVKLVVTHQAKLYLVGCGYDREYGARQLKRIVTSKVEDRLSEEIIKGNVLEGETVTVDYQNDKLIFSSK